MEPMAAVPVEDDERANFDLPDALWERLANLAFASSLVAAVFALAAGFIGGRVWLVSEAVGGPTILGAFVVLAALTVMFGPAKTKIDDRLFASAVIVFFATTVGAAVGLARSGFSSGEITGLVIGSFFGRGAFMVAVVFLTLRLRHQVSRVPVVPVVGLLVHAIATGFTSGQASGALSFGSSADETVLLFVGSMASWSLVAAAALTALATRTRELSSLLARATFLIAIALASSFLVLILRGGLGEIDRFGNDFAGFVLSSVAGQPVGFLVLATACSLIASARSNAQHRSSDGATHFPVLGWCTVATVLFWPVGIAAVAASARGDRSGASATSMLAIAIGFVVWGGLLYFIFG